MAIDNRLNDIMPSNTLSVPLDSERIPIVRSSSIPYSSTFSSDVADSFRQTLMGQVIASNESGRNFNNQDFDPAFLNPSDELIEGYEDFREYLSGSYNAAHLYSKKEFLDKNIKARQRLSASHRIFLPQLVAELGNPINYIPIPLFKGVGLLPRVLKGGLVAGATVGAFEPPRRKLDPTSTNAESFMYVGSSFLLGGIFTGAFGGGATPLGKKIYSGTFKRKGGYNKIQDNFDKAPSITEGRKDFEGSYIYRGQDDAEVNIVYMTKAQIKKRKKTIDIEFEEGKPPTLYINEAQARADFHTKAYNKIIEGVEAFPENSFKDSDEYLTFLIKEAILTKIFKVGKLTDEVTEVAKNEAAEELIDQTFNSKQQLELKNKIRLQALEELNAQATADYTSENNFLTRQFEKFTNLGFVANSDVSPKVKLSLLRLSGDYGVQSRAAKEGIAVPNSAWLQSATIWNPVYSRNYLQRMNIFTKYRTDATKEPKNVLDIAVQANVIRGMDAVRKGVSKLTGQEVKNDRMTFVEFKEYIFEAITNPNHVEVDPVLRAAMDNEIEYYRTFGKALEENGMFQSVKTVEVQLKSSQARLNRYKEIKAKSKFNPSQKIRSENVIAREMANVKAFKDLIKKLKQNESKDIMANLEFEKFSQDINYLPRMYDHDAMMANKDEFIQIAQDWIKQKPFYRDQTDERNLKIATDIYNKIMDLDILDPEGLAGFAKDMSGKISSGNKPLMSRSFNIPTVLISKFVIKDVEYLAKTYHSRVPRALEMKKIYGDHHLQGELQDIEFDLIINNLKTDKDNLLVDKILNAIEDEKDKMLGALSFQDPSSINKRTANFLVNAASLAFMGKVLFSAVVDAARPIMVHGFSRTYKDGLKQWATNIEGYGKAAKNVKNSMGVASEVVQGGAMKRVISDDGVLGGASGWLGNKADKIINAFNNVQGMWYMANGLTPWTQMMKEFTGVLSVHRLLEDCLKVSKGTITEKDMLRLLSYGIDEKTARLIASMPHENYRGLLTANVLEWGSIRGGDTARRQFRNAIFADVERTIITPSVADKPNLMSGVIRFSDEDTAKLLDNKFGKFIGFQRTARGGKISNAFVALPFQFMSWGVAAQRKLVQSGMTGREQNLMGGLLAMLSLGFVSDYMKNPEYFKRKSFEEKLMRSVEISGVLAMTGEFEKVLSTFSNTVLKKNISLRGAVGLDARYQDDLYDFAGLAGAGPSLFMDTAVDFANASTAKEASKELRGVVPAQGLFYMNWLFDLLESGTSKVLSPFYNSDIVNQTN